ncbi:hypothetical protein O6H91_12G053600 [Diphasiastrum complanatum]|uniref:Uncharacterized protein n=1 Tax=Diphasiastrum complanatum TaxID=34168 RepID=A0ACC2C1X7_DIPCM|nr:hypothetical protein O6H91_12G053600 [Diphasiastrum complanatum]
MNCSTRAAAVVSGGGVIANVSDDFHENLTNQGSGQLRNNEFITCGEPSRLRLQCSWTLPKHLPEQQNFINDLQIQFTGTHVTIQENSICTRRHTARATIKHQRGQTLHQVCLGCFANFLDFLD